MRETEEAAREADRAALEKRELNRLKKSFKNLPENHKKLVDGLLVQAARLRVSLDILSEDIAQNGMTELFQQSEKVDPYERERPAASLFLKMDKNYQAVIRQLCDLCPDTVEGKDKLAEFLRTS